MSVSRVGHKRVCAPGHTFWVGGGDWHKRKRRSFAGFARSVFGLFRKRNAILGLWKVLQPGLAGFEIQRVGPSKIKSDDWTVSTRK